MVICYSAETATPVELEEALEIGEGEGEGGEVFLFITKDPISISSEKTLYGTTLIIITIFIIIVNCHLNKIFLLFNSDFFSCTMP